MKSRAATLYSRTYVSWNARCSFCYNTSIAEMHGVPLVTTRRLAEMHAKIHGWNQELQRSIHGHTLAEMRGVSFCYNTLIAEMHSVPFVTLHMTKSDSWNTRTKSRAAMLSLRTCDSWNAQCSFCYITYDSCNALMKSGAAMLPLRTYDSWNARWSFWYDTSLDEMAPLLRHIWRTR